MTESEASLTLDRLSEFYEKAERPSQFFLGRLKAHLATLYPILVRHRVFGKYLGVRDGMARAVACFAVRLIGRAVSGAAALRGGAAP